MCVPVYQPILTYSGGIGCVSPYVTTYPGTTSSCQGLDNTAPIRSRPGLRLGLPPETGFPQPGSSADKAYLV